jgi:hypothetical protein
MHQAAIHGLHRGPLMRFLHLTVTPHEGTALIVLLPFLILAAVITVRVVTRRLREQAAVRQTQAARAAESIGYTG